MISDRSIPLGGYSRIRVRQEAPAIEPGLQFEGTNLDDVARFEKVSRCSG